MSLYADWDGKPINLPAWATRAGLRRSPQAVRRIYAAGPHIAQAEADGIAHVSPVLALLNASPAEARARLGGEHWKAVHHSTVTANANRLVFGLLGGWSIPEIMAMPPMNRPSAKYLLSHHGKTVILMAGRLAAKGGDFHEFLTMARDVQRMGGTLDLSWGRKRLRREHDALVMAYAVRWASPAPWADPWFHDVGPWTFTLLKSELELVIEGGIQRHCAGSYARDCKAGRETVLSIQGPERATCSWRKGGTEIQVKGRFNADVSAECVLAAKEARLAFLAHQRKQKA